jgi:ribosome-binding factor A
VQSTRQNKVSRLLQKELADFFQRESFSRFNKEFITVTMVRISPDLSFARVYLSLFKSKDPNATLGLIKAQSAEIRKHIGLKIGKQVRIIPAFEFFIDDSLDYAEHIDQLLNK